MIRFQCECGRTLQARPEDIGKNARCPACGQVQPVPAETQAFTGAPPPPPPPPPARDRGRDDQDDRDRRPRRDDHRERDRRRDDEYDDRDDRRRRRDESEPVSGKATAAMALGIASFCLSLLTAVPGAILGILALRDISASRGRLAGRGAAIAGLVCSGLGVFLWAVAGVLLIPAYQKVNEARDRVHEVNNLKQIGLALHSYHDNYNGLPAATAFKTRDGRPGLSWRVAILPYIEQQGLYAQFRLDEPWDSPNNLPLLARMPKTYQQPGRETSDGSTFYQAIVGRGTAFEDRKPPGIELPGVPRRGVGFVEFTDGTSNTILIAAADRAVPWTKPEDMTYDPKGPVPALNRRFSAGANAVMADGSVRPIRATVAEQTLRALITRNEGQPVPGDW